jgi:branched-chain amino acid aminotransferase
MIGNGSRTFLPACWVNGRRVDPTTAQLMVTERGFTIADGLFETMRVYRGSIFRLDAHLTRLAASADRMGLICPQRLPDVIAEVVHELRSHESDAAVRLTVTRGAVPGGLAPPPADALSVTVVILVTPVPDFPDSIYRSGLRVHTVSGRRNEFALSAGIKSLAYTDSVLALIEARAHQADEALFLDTRGHLSEASASNVFVRIDDEVRTPPLSCGVLPGITRAVVKELLDEQRIAVREDPITPDELARADEMFLTSSLRGIAPVSVVDGRSLIAPGAITRAAMDGYAALVLDECTR